MKRMVEVSEATIAIEEAIGGGQLVSLRTTQIPEGVEKESAEKL